MEELLEQLAQTITQNVETELTARLRREFETLFTARMKFIYAETDAAEFLGVPRSVLVGWRKRGLITYARYPIGRMRDGHQPDTLGDTYTYSLADLVSFRERYLIQAVSADRFALSAVDGGPGLKEKKWFKAA